MQAPYRSKLYEVIFWNSYQSRKNFDLILLWTIILSVLVVMMESIKPIQMKYANCCVYLNGLLQLFSHLNISQEFIVIQNR